MERGTKKQEFDQALAALADAAMDTKVVSGWTHNFYRYPARFSPRFAAAAIDRFSKKGDVVLDPYMGGGTTIVEGVAAGRHVIGNDLNSLAAFVTRAKITPLKPSDVRSLQTWARTEVQSFRYDTPARKLKGIIDEDKTKNLSLSRARFIKKAIAAALLSIESLPSRAAQNFAKCAVLRVGQWALDGRSRHTPLREFRERLATTTEEMLSSVEALAQRVNERGGHATLLNMDAAELPTCAEFRNQRKVGLVVTSPPYPGVHVLYHRWQVDGRRETPAPYWIAGTNDGNGASFYNFSDRRRTAVDGYFKTSLATLKATRALMRPGAFMVQLVAFNDPSHQLPLYLANMDEAGFVEVVGNRIWRQVPNRKWHANLTGVTHSANEVVLVHRAS